jgi:hypothetical protein
MRRIILCILCLSLTRGPLHAQITISRSQVEAVFTPGSTVRTYVDSSSQTLNIGRTGGPNVYNLSALPFYYQGRDTNFAVNQIPRLAARYPSGSNVLKLIPEPGFISYFVSSFSSSQMASPGDAFVVSPSIEYYEHFNPPGILTMFPVSYNTQFSQSVVAVETTYFNGFPISTSSTPISSNTYVDGYGTLLLPGLTLNCLRMRSVENLPNNYKEFRFLTQEGAIVLISSSNTQPDTGVVAIDGITYLLGGPLSSVPGDNTLPTSFALHQNYPNPFNPSTTMRFEIPVPGIVSLKVYNVLGQEVATLVNEMKQPGAYEVTWNADNYPSGVYFYRLSGESFTETRKLIFMR